MAKEKTITCYRGILTLSFFIYHPKSNKLIEKADNGSWVRSKELPPPPNFREYYMKIGRSIEIKESDFNELYNKCIEAEKTTSEAKDLASKLFK